MWWSELRLVVTLSLVLAALAASSCGGGTGQAGSALVLISLDVDSLDNVRLNQVLHFRFSERILPSSIGPATVHIRAGETFGEPVQGTFEVDPFDPSLVRFRPKLAGTCGLEDGGLRADTRYRIVLQGHPEEFAILSTGGDKLEATRTLEFRTVSTGGLFFDAVPSLPPAILSSTPGPADPGVSDTAVDVFGRGPGADGVLGTADDLPGNEVRIVISEGLDPCTVSKETVRFAQWQTGDPAVTAPAPNGNATGFAAPGTDMVPADVYVWDAGRPSAEQAIDYSVELLNDYEQTEIVIRPTFGEFLDNALFVVELSGTIRDFGASPLPATRISFTTENRPPQISHRTLPFERVPGDPTLDNPPIDDVATNADVDTVRSPSKAQGFLIVTGDGDNGDQIGLPAGPLPCVGQLNSGSQTPLVVDAADAVLSTGATPNTCPNATDGSLAVVWELSEIEIRAPRTLRITGVNGAILLVAGDVLLEAGARIVAMGARGEDAMIVTNNNAPIAEGGAGIAGGGRGGDGGHPTRPDPAGKHGFAPLGSPEFDASMTPGGVGEGGIGGGRGGANVVPQDVDHAASQGGGGGGHGTAGSTGLMVNNLPNNVYESVAGSGGGGATVGTPELRRASAGGGGGGSGHYPVACLGFWTTTACTTQTAATFNRPGAGGGGGGGFLDITCQGRMEIHGTIDVRGGDGGIGGHASSSFDTGGGGGGAGGAIRLLTPLEIDVTGAVLTAAGGAGGTAMPGAAGVAANDGGNGAMGRIALEDADSVITGFASATIEPATPGGGLWRGTFDASRFAGGGAATQCVTLPFPAGPLHPVILTPSGSDFDAELPAAVARGPGKVGILVELEGYPRTADGSADLAQGTGWWTVGYLADSGDPTAPTFVAGVNPPLGPLADLLSLPDANQGAGVSALNAVPGGCGYLRIRLTFYEKTTGVGPNDPGPAIDTWRLRMRYDQ